MFFSALLLVAVALHSVLADDLHKHHHKCHHQKVKGNCHRNIFHWKNSCKDDKSATATTGISQDLLDQIHLMAEYSAAAYWPGNNNSTDTSLTCSVYSCTNAPKGNCPMVEAANASTTVEFKDTPKFDDHGYVAIDPKNQLVVLAFRGSKSDQNWKEDLKIGKSCSDLCKNCKVHEGFWESWVGIRDMVIPNVLAATNEHPDYRFIVTGHSLGGALATVAAADIRKNSTWLLEHTELFSFGSPRVGNAVTAEFMTKQSSKSYRVTATADPVPRLPLTSMHYVHTSPEYWIRSDPEEPRKENVVVLTGYWNSKGNSGTEFQTFDDHRRYFGWISKCDPYPPGDPGHDSMWKWFWEMIL